MKLFILLLIINCQLNCQLATWHECRYTIPLEITRRVNAWYRATGDVDNYARIVRAGWSEAEFEKVLAEGSV